MYNFIVNPNAGSGRGMRVWTQVARYMHRHRIAYKAELTESRGDARRMAYALTKDNSEPITIFIVGGDGTVNEVVDGLCFHAPVKLGYIPAGTGNDMARSLKLRGGSVKCLKRQILGGSTRTVDYGVLCCGSKTQEIAVRRFIVSCGIGYDAQVCEAAHRSKWRQRLGRFGLRRLTYGFFGLHVFLQSRPSKGYILLDGTQRVEFNNILFISCHIQPSEGGGCFFAPGADGSDGLLDVCVFSHPSRVRLLGVLLSAFLGRLKRRCGMRTYRCRYASVHTDVALPVHADGESCGLQTDIYAECISGRLKFLV